MAKNPKSILSEASPDERLKYILESVQTESI